MRFNSRVATVITIVVALISYFITGSFLGSIILSVLILFLIGFIARSISGRRSSQKGTASMRVDVFPQNDRSGGSALLKWKGIGEILNANKYTIIDPLTYYSEGAINEREASCIQLNLPIGKARSDTPRLDDYPQYGGMTPDQRSFYLEWMASRRSMPITDIGYVFTFFYGLQRRALIEHKDLFSIIDEVIRLLKLYSFNDSFNGYAIRLVTQVLARNLDGIAVGDNDNKTEVQEINQKWLKQGDSWLGEILKMPHAKWDAQSIAIALAWTQKREGAISSDLAMKVLEIDTRIPESSSSKRASEQVKNLFVQKYSQNFGDGLVLKATKRELKTTRIIEYQPGNPSDCFNRQDQPPKPLVKIPEVHRDKYNPLIDLWKNCI